MAQHENEIDWSDVHQAQKQEADRVRSGAALPAYVVHETFYDGSLHVENQLQREMTMRRKRQD